MALHFPEGAVHNLRVLGDSIDFNQDVAVSFWLNGSLVGNTRPLQFGSGYSGGGILMYLLVDTATVLSVITTNVTTGGWYKIPSGVVSRWRHIYLYFSGGLLVNTYLNGVRQTVTTQTAPVGVLTNSGLANTLLIGGTTAGCRGALHDLCVVEGATGSLALASPSIPARIAKGERSIDVFSTAPSIYASLDKKRMDIRNMDPTTAITGSPYFVAPPVQTLRSSAIRRPMLYLVASAAGAPNITSLGTKLEPGQALVIDGGSFGAETGDAAVTISPADDIGDAGAVVQTPTAWADDQITVASADTTGMADGDTVYVFVTDSAGVDSASQSVAIADMCLRVGPPVATNDILDTDTGIAIASETLTKVAVLTTNLETVVAAYPDAAITAGKFEYDDAAVANITTEGDAFVVLMDSGDDRLGALRATVVDRNED